MLDMFNFDFDPANDENSAAHSDVGGASQQGDNVQSDGGIAGQAPADDPQPHQIPRRRKEIVIRDPEKRNDQGGFVESPALLLGRLAMRGTMAVELPSENHEFPSCPRRYIVKCKDYGIRWGSLHMLQTKNKEKLVRIARAQSRQYGFWAPQIIGIISSPQYASEVQANPFHILGLRLPDRHTWREEWHSKSDAFAVFGDLTDEMMDYWFRSGQKEPTKPREIHHREYLQFVGVQQGGERRLGEVDIEAGAVKARLRRETTLLNRQRLASERRQDPGAGGSNEAESRPIDADLERGRRRERSPTL